MQGHNFNRTLHAKGVFVYCGRCGLALAKTCREYLIEENNKKGANYANLYE